MKCTKIGVAAAAGLVGVAVLGGCACTEPPEGLAERTHVEPTSVLGTWRSEKGSTLTVTRADEGFKAVLKNEREERAFLGHVVSVGGAQFVEVSMFQPGGKKGERPVFHYGKVSVSGDRMTHTPIRAEWMKQQVEGKPGMEWVSTAGVEPHSGGAVVKDAAAMQAILEQAAKDPGAFGESDVLTRVKR